VWAPWGGGGRGRGGRGSSTCFRRVQDHSRAAVHPQLLAVLEHLPFALVQQPRAVAHAAARLAPAHMAHAQRQAKETAGCSRPCWGW